MAAEALQQPFAVQPQPAGGAAAVALPGRRFVGRGAGEEEGFALPAEVGDLDVGDRPPGQFAARVAGRGDLVGPGEVGERLAVRGHGQDLAVRGPAADPGVGAAPVAHLAARAAVHRDDVDLGHQAAPARVREVAAVGREAGVAQFGAVDGEPPGPAGGVERGEPEVVLGHEAQQVVMEVRQAQIGHVLMLCRGTDQGKSRQIGARDPAHVRNGFVSLRGALPWCSTKPCRSEAGR